MQIVNIAVYDYIEYILTFIYSIANSIGGVFQYIFEYVFSWVAIPPGVAETVGFLVILTVFVFLIQLTRKFAILVLIIGWVFIGIKLILIIFGMN